MSHSLFKVAILLLSLSIVSGTEYTVNRVKIVALSNNERVVTVLVDKVGGVCLSYSHEGSLKAVKEIGKCNNTVFTCLTKPVHFLTSQDVLDATNWALSAYKDKLEEQGIPSSPLKIKKPPKGEAHWIFTTSTSDLPEVNPDLRVVDKAKVVEEKLTTRLRLLLKVKDIKEQTYMAVGGKRKMYDLDVEATNMEGDEEDLTVCLRSKFLMKAIAENGFDDNLQPCEEICVFEDDEYDASIVEIEDKKKDHGFLGIVYDCLINQYWGEGGSKEKAETKENEKIKDTRTEL